MRDEPASPNSDESLWNAFKGGDEVAFAHLYQRYVRVLYNYGYHFVADPDLLQDAIQDLFIDLWRLRATLADTTSVKFYLFRSLRRRIHLAVGKCQTEQTLPPYDLAEPVCSAEDELIQQEKAVIDHVTLQHHMTLLPVRQYEAIQLRFFDGFSWADSARIMQIDEQSVRNLVQRAITKLRQYYGLLTFLMLIGNCSPTL